LFFGLISGVPGYTRSLITQLCVCVSACVHKNIRRTNTQTLNWQGMGFVLLRGVCFGPGLDSDYLIFDFRLLVFWFEAGSDWFLGATPKSQSEPASIQKTTLKPKQNRLKPSPVQNRPPARALPPRACPKPVRKPSCSHANPANTTYTGRFLSTETPPQKHRL
jgi:hypothetical protein